MRLSIEYRLILSILLLSFSSRAQDLILDNGGTPAMNGEHTYDVISLTQSSTIMVSGGTNTLTLICDSLYMESGSSIRANSISQDDSHAGQYYQAKDLCLLLDHVKELEILLSMR